MTYYLLNIQGVSPKQSDPKTAICVHCTKCQNVKMVFTVEMDDLPPKIKDDSPKTILSLVENTFLHLNYAG